MHPKKEHYRGKLPHYQQPGQWYFITCTLRGAMPKGAMQKYSLALEAAKNRVKELEVSGVGVCNSNSPLGVGNSPSPSPLTQAKKEYQITQRKYRLAYDKFVHKSNTPNFSLVTNNNLKIITEALQFWEGKRLHSHAWCIMSNHFHWVVSLFEQESAPLGELDIVSPTENRELDFEGPTKHRESDFASPTRSWELEAPSPNTPSPETSSPGQGQPVYLQDILHSIKRYTAREINKNENRTGQLWEHESFDTTIRNEKHFYNVVNYTIQNPVSARLVKHWREWEATFLESELVDLF